MPSAKKGAKKKGKKSKKVLEQERLLLEEQRRKEEESARLEEIARQQEKELRENTEREKWDSMLEELSSEFKKERESAVSSVRDLDEVFKNELEETQKNKMWKKYLECSYIPDTKSEPSVNAFLEDFQRPYEFMNKETPEALLPVDMNNGCELIQSCMYEYALAKDFEGKKFTRHLDTVKRVNKCLFQKWDALTAYILQLADVYWKDTTENMTLGRELPQNCSFILWVNYTRNPRYKSFAFANVHVSLPKAVTLASVGIRVVCDRSPVSLCGLYYEQQSNERFAITGCVLYFNIFEVPEPPKTNDFWTIRQMIENKLETKEMRYPFLKSDPSEENSGYASIQEDGEEKNTQITDSTGGSSSLGAPSSNGQNAYRSSSQDLQEASTLSRSSENVTKDDDNAIAVSYSIGAGYLIHSLATVKWWDEKRKTWSSQGISDVEIDRSLGVVNFKTLVLKPLALVQEASLEFPLESWSIMAQKKSVPESESLAEPASTSVVLKLNGKWNDADIEITPAGVRLLRPKQEPLGSAFGNKTLLPTQFFQELTSYGLSFCSPSEESLLSTEEEDIYHAMATSCLGLAFQSQRESLEKPYYAFRVTKQDQSQLSIVVSHAYVIVTKPRRLVYVARPDSLDKMDASFKPHESVKRMLDEIGAHNQVIDRGLVKNVLSVLRIARPLDKRELSLKQ